MRRVPLLVLISTMAVLLFTYMNCSQTRLVSVPKSFPSLPKAIPPVGGFCSGLSEAQTFPNKFLFIFDMSLSNLGGAMSVGGAGGYRWCTGKDMFEDARCRDCSDGWCADNTNPGIPGIAGPNLITDSTGQRFQLARNFVLDCGQSNTSNRYSFMGFGTDALPEAGALCRASFKEATPGLLDIDHFASLQTQDDAVGPLASTTNQNPPYNMGNTSYLKGLNCAEQRIGYDLDQSSYQKSLYQVFFLTDGKPTDKVTVPGSTPRPVDAEVYAQVVSNINLMIEGHSSSFRLQPVYYGKESELAEAKLVLDEMAIQGGTPGTIVGSDMAQIKNQLCQMVPSGPTVPNQISKYFAFNLNAVYTGGDLKADSDADGLPDSDEVTNGWSATDPRSSGALDGLCNRWYGGQRRCDGTAQCKNVHKGLRVTKCEEDLLSSSLTGGDTDQDSILDGLELLRSTEALLSDMMLDYDDDKMSNYQELIRGFDVRNGTAPILDREIKIKYTPVSPLTLNCEYSEQSYSFSIDQLPLVSVQPYTESSDTLLDLSHKANENVVLIGYKIESPLDSAKWQIWGTVLKVAIGSTQRASINPDQFVLLAQSEGW